MLHLSFQHLLLRHLCRCHICRCYIFRINMRKCDICHCEICPSAICCSVICCFDICFFRLWMLHPWAMRMFGQKRKISAKFLWAHAYLPSLEKIVKDRKGVNLLLTLFYSYWSYVWRIVMYCIMLYGCTANYGRSHLSIQIKTVHYCVNSRLSQVISINWTQ